MAQIDEMLRMLPLIANAVNAFESETVQVRAFEALLDAMTGKPSAPGPAAPAATGGSAQVKRQRGKRASGPQTNGTSEAKAQRTRRPGTGRLSVVGELDLRPAGKQSFSEFVKLKTPSSVTDRIAVATFYLKHTVGLDKVATNHIYTCFKDVGWRLPANLPNAISVAASRHSLLHTGGLIDITLTSKGENLVEHDLPPTSKK